MKAKIKFEDGREYMVDLKPIPSEKDEIKVFEESTMLECLKKMKEEGYRPATLKETWQLRKDKKVSDKGYDTGTIYLEGEVRTATEEELENIKEVYNKGGRMLFLYYDYNGLVGSSSLDDNGRFVGVAPEAPKP